MKDLNTRNMDRFNVDSENGAVERKRRASQDQPLALAVKAHQTAHAFLIEERLEAWRKLRGKGFKEACPLLSSEFGSLSPKFHLFAHSLILPSHLSLFHFLGCGKFRR